ncbi:sensor histidine kinase [uncultured Jatrophihabitans sp.]|uniref:sensor histidine kinase n=1 Tax=uncultured Jatrophihabitans sp. TaxID=1610747 RepID=UPI0035CB8403
MAVVLIVTNVIVGLPDWTGSDLVVFDSLCMTGVCLLVWWRRRFPISVAVAAGVLLLISYFNSAGATVSDQAVSDAAVAGSFLIAFALGTQLPWARSLLGLLPLTAGLAILGAQFNPFLLMITFGPWGIGLILASRQRAVDQLARRARELVGEREVFAAASVRYERARIARELHDVVAHSMTLMVVQANAGAYLAGTDPNGAAEALDAITETAAQARAEIDRLASLLDTTCPAEQGGLEVVDELVHRAQTAGLKVTYQVSGEVDSLLGSSIDAIHRIVQEAITNALKHAPGAEVTVTLHGGAEIVDLAVHNHAAPATLASSASLGLTGGGHGIAGMRARVHRHGGEFQAGPNGHGGWDVTARFPRRMRVST